MTADFIPYARPDLDEDDLAAVLAVLRTPMLTQGPAVPAFERGVADRVGARFAVAVSSATAALHLACLAAGLGPGDRLWTSANSFAASANCGLYCGAEVDFVDVARDTLCMDPGALAAKLEAAEREGRLPKVVIPVHFAGHACDMEAIGRLADRYGFAVVEDASHALGSLRDGRPVGACDRSAMCVFSFHAVKLVASAEGGMVTTNDPALAARLARLRTHGITRDPAEMEGPSPGDWYYEQVELGFNYRLTDVQAALGASQLRRLDAFVARRNHLVRRYDFLLAGLPLSWPRRDPRVLSAFHLHVVRLDPGRDRAAVFRAMRAAGIGVNVHYLPIHLHPHYRRLGFRPGLCPEAEAYYEAALTLPLHTRLTEGDQDRVVAALAEALR